jgi:hypothetical protein
MSSSVDHSDYDIVVRVDSHEVTKNTLVPGLIVVRVLDEKDKNNRLHHSYHLMYSGDVGLAVDGKLTATLIGPTAIEVVMPAFTSSFLTNFEAVKSAVREKKKVSSSSMKAFTTAANKIANNEDTQTIKVLVLFDDTGEELTNGVFSESAQRFGTIPPKAVIFEGTFDINGTTYHETSLYCGFIVARVETEERMAAVATPMRGNALAADLAAGMEGTNMTYDDTDDDG